MTEPVSKRMRESSSSSETDMETATVLSKEDHAMLASMNEQMKKLDLLHEVIKDIVELKSAVDFTNKLMEDLKKENELLKTNVSTLQTTTEKLCKENKQMKAELLDLKCRSMRNNIVVMGVKEEETENYTVTENLLKQFMKKELKMSDEQVADVEIERAHRIGRKKDPKKPRPIVARFLNFKMKMSVLERGRELKGTSLSINEQFPQEILERRRVLYPIMKSNRAQNIKVRLTMDKLYINNQLFRDSKVTTWL